MAPFVYLGALLLVCAAPQQQELPADVVLLSKIKARVAENLTHLPDFTCTETIRRSIQYKGHATADMVDTIRLDVAFVNHQELYGWTGEGKIDQTDPTRMVGGSIANGYFASFLNNIFLVSTTTFHYAGHVKLDGQDMLQYDYKVPQIAGAYRLRSLHGHAVVGYHGSFWLKEGTLDPLRINIAADDIPSDSGFGAAISRLDYGPVDIRGKSFVLPGAGEFTFTDTDGNQSRNNLSFRACREFVGESTVRFETAEAGPKIALPDEFSAELELATPVDAATSAGGDRIEATLVHALKAADGSTIPEGARFSGRLGHVTKTGASYSMDLVFTAIDYPAGRADLTSRVNDVVIKDHIDRSSEGLIYKAGTHIELHSRMGTAK